ncbi:Spore cortex-lytic enzyme precursor [compost metagenome]
MQKLFGVGSKKSGTPVTASTSDRDLLARIIAAEADSEPYEGQVAVGAVVLNRVKSTKFPNSIRDVIYASGQFEPVSNGRFDRVKPTETQYKAADEALSGVDPTDGAVYFYAPTLTKQRWHETLTLTFELGGHRFFK